MPTLLPPNHTGVTRFTTGQGAATYATCPISFQNNAAWTIEFWCSLDALVDQMPMVTKGTEFMLASRGQTLYAALGGQTVPLVSQALLDTSIPYYICVIYDGLTMSMYLNGALAAQATTSANPPASSAQLTIGNGFYGEIQGLRLWTQAMNANILGQNQFNSFAAGTPSLAVQDDFTVTPPVDTSGNNIVPTLNQYARYLPFVPAGVLVTSSFCDPYNDGAVNPGGGQSPFSVSAWICPDINGGLMYIFTNGVAESNSGMTLGIGTDGKLFFQVGDGTVLTSSATLTDGVWVFVAVTWTPPAAGALYINGALDSSSAAMQLAGTLANGEPLIGAIASVGTQLPINSFDGQLQNVCVWNVALTAAQIAGYQTATPQTDPTCIAYYDFSQAPAQNQVSFNPVGLVSGAALAPAPVYTGGSMGARAEARAIAPNPAALAAEPPLEPMPDIDDEAFFAAAEAEYERFMGGFRISEEQRNFFRNLHSERLRQGREDFLNGVMADFNRVRIDVLDAGGARMTFVHADGTEEVISDGLFDACTLWCIQLLVAIVGALWLALGLAFNYSRFLQGMTNFFGTRINSIGIMPQLIATFRNGVTGQGIYTCLKLLYEYSLLTSIAKLSYQLIFSSLSWWTILSLAMRIVLLMSPTAVLEILWLVAQLAYSIYSIVQLLQQRPPGCLN
ncbi:LamG domain-containing protein [Sphingomonas sp. LB-2]|uniref:LamG domain-containing protein n=1 Tax=Sphingomonas caeni TaxID=2984949 RepID=UPI00222FE056|nr:LamG domain-containing protein [Sphingomonas caeni]MCW3845687.1 LamG domain-containing protein [Sphingomonas caeni]